MYEPFAPKTYRPGFLTDAETATRRALTRRSFLCRAMTLTGMAAAGPLLAACAGSDDSTGAASNSSAPTTAASSSAAAWTTPAAAGTSATPAIVAAAEAFTATLDTTQVTTLQLAYPAAGTIATTADFSGRVGEQFGTSVWSNYPISDVIRKGLRLGDLTDAQRTSATAVLQAALSARGYDKIRNIMDADQILSDSGTNYDCGADNYVITFVGTPSETDTWMLRFGGHHLGLNITIQGDQQTMAPTLTGCQPSSFAGSTDTVMPLGAETDAAFALANKLTDAQLQQAVLNPAVNDLVLGPGQDGQKLDPVGIPGSAMTSEQQTLLLAVVEAWVGTLNHTAAGTQLATVTADMAKTYFAWSGEIAEGSTVYFRVTAPTVITEYADQGSANGGGPGGDGTGVQAGGVNHIHAVFRSVDNNSGFPASSTTTAHL